MAKPLLKPVGGTPRIISTDAALADAVAEIISGSGPIAIDAERASGYRYSQRAYLIQIKRRNGGLHLIDPISFASSDIAKSLIKDLNVALSEVEWVIHASTQDLSCLREFGLEPKHLFDTELGGRLAGCERVGLGPLTEALLDLTLAKEHSAVDWSYRPLHPEWLNYAALDVEVLLDLRDAIENLLNEQGKLNWAKADFAAILAAPPPPPRKDPWRRTSGMHKVKNRRDLAIIRELWFERDRIAKDIDLAPGKVLNDALIVEVAIAKPNTLEDFQKIPIISNRLRSEEQKRFIPDWFGAVERAQHLLESELPESKSFTDAMPPVKVWRDKFPLAFARLSHARFAVANLGIELAIPTENLISPEIIRRIAWLSQSDTALIGDSARISERMVNFGARIWQAELTAELVAAGLTNDQPLELPEPVELKEPSSEPET